MICWRGKTDNGKGRTLPLLGEMGWEEMILREDLLAGVGQVHTTNDKHVPKHASKAGLAVSGRQASRLKGGMQG